MNPAFNKSKTGVSLLLDVYKTFCYFDIFSYPLRKEEVGKFSPVKIKENELKYALDELVNLNKITLHRNYYLLKGASIETIDTRIENEIRYTRRLPVIKKFAKLVTRFPFVEAVFISGSVSKGVLNEDGDIDYFIVAKPGRLWLCRTIMVMFKKLILFNSKKYFCVNYFVSSDNLRIPDENIFVATEIKTLLPVFKNKHTIALHEENKWAENFLPNSGSQPEPLFTDSKNGSFIKLFIERVGKGNFGEKLDDLFFKYTLKRWQKKFPHFKHEEFDLNMRSYKNVSKHHPRGFQGKVLESLNERLQKFEQ